MSFIKKILAWFKYRNHPCYTGNGEFDHDLECVDDSFDHAFGTEQIQYLQCTVCDSTSEEDSEIPDVWDYYSDEDYAGL